MTSARRLSASATGASVATMRSTAASLRLSLTPLLHRARRGVTTLAQAARASLYFRAHSWTHPEGWRDWPYETPATISRERERCQFHQAPTKAWEMWLELLPLRTFAT